MATSETTNLQLVKYGAGTDNFIRTDYNGNLEKIDTFAGNTNEAIGNLNSKFAWKYIDRKQGTSAIDLPSDANEYLFVVNYGTSGGIQSLAFSMLCPNNSYMHSDVLTNGYLNNSNSNGVAQVFYNHSTHTAALSAVQISGGDYTSTSYLTAYYR